ENARRFERIGPTADAPARPVLPDGNSGQSIDPTRGILSRTICRDVIAWQSMFNRFGGQSPLIEYRDCRGPMLPVLRRTSAVMAKLSARMPWAALLSGRPRVRAQIAHRNGQPRPDAPIYPVLGWRASIAPGHLSLHLVYWGCARRRCPQ